MNIMTFEDFKRYYEKHKMFPGQISKSSKVLSDSKLLIKYQNWYKKEEKKLSKPKKVQKRIETKTGTNKDEKWLEVVKTVKNRDDNECQFLKKLEELNMLSEIEYIFDNHPTDMLKIIDPAHIIPKSKGKEYYYNPNNIVCLNRVSHSYLDQMLHPIFGTKISKLEREEWWKFIVGKDRYEALNV